MKARSALGKVYCGRLECHGRLPVPAAPEIRWAPDDQVVFELNRWRADDAGVERSVDRNRGSRSVRRARANTDAVDAGEKMKAYEVARVDGRRAKTLPFLAACPLCGAVNVIDAALAAEV